LQIKLLNTKMKHLKYTDKYGLYLLKLAHMTIIVLLLSVIIIKHTATPFNDLTSKNAIEQTAEEDSLDENDTTCCDFICSTKLGHLSAGFIFGLKTTYHQHSQLMVSSSKGVEDPPPENILI